MNTFEQYLIQLFLFVELQLLAKISNNLNIGLSIKLQAVARFSCKCAVSMLVVYHQTSVCVCVEPLNTHVSLVPLLSTRRYHYSPTSACAALQLSIDNCCRCPRSAANQSHAAAAVDRRD